MSQGLRWALGRKLQSRQRTVRTVELGPSIGCGEGLGRDQTDGMMWAADKLQTPPGRLLRIEAKEAEITFSRVGKIWVCGKVALMSSFPSFTNFFLKICFYLIV